MRNRRCEIAFSFSKVCSVQEFSRTIFNWALPTIPCRLMMRHAVGTPSANRCKRYQLVCGIFRNSSGVFRTRSTITSGKLPSRKRKSAALMASNAFRQRTQSKCRNAELSDEPGSNESEPSINATKWRSRWAALRSAWRSDALPALGRGVINSVIALFGRPPPLARSKKGKPVVKTEAAGAERAGNRSESAFRRSIMTAGVAMTNHGTKEEYVQANIYIWRETRRRGPPNKKAPTRGALQRKLTSS